MGLSDISLHQAYTSQYVALLMMALQLSEDRISFTERRNQIIAALHELPIHIKKILKQDSVLQQLATTVSSNKSLLLMGRGYQYAVVTFFSPVFVDMLKVCHLPGRRSEN